LLDNCRQTADLAWHGWYRHAARPLLDVAAITRLQWLLAGRSPRAAPGDDWPACLRIEIPGSKRTLSLAEVEVLAGGTDVARGARALQSSTFEAAYAARAVDGATDGDYGHGSVSHTAVDGDWPWWEVALPSGRHVDAVRVWNRTDACGERLAGARVLLLDGRRNALWSAPIEAAPPRDLLLPVGLALPRSANVLRFPVR
jgi:hypothetical protein